jgi:hypothetical protein
VEPLPIIVKEGSMLRAAGIAIIAAGVGLGILLACWGASFFFNPDDGAVLKRLDVLTEKVEELAQRPDRTDEVVAKLDDEAGKIGEITAKLDSLNREAGKIGGNITTRLASIEGSLEELKHRPIIAGNPSDHEKTVNGNVITREVTVFREVPHDNGRVITGWKYPDGASADQRPTSQYCYWKSEPVGGTTSSAIIYIANDGVRLQNIGAGVPRLEDALKECVWWNGSTN